MKGNDQLKAADLGCGLEGELRSGALALTWNTRSTRRPTIKAALRLEKPAVQKPAGNETLLP
jgi:hypothetical protein